MIEWSWRVERPRSIYFGSFSTDRKINNCFPKISGSKVVDIYTEGRLPELVVKLSNGQWIQSFMTAEGQPAWVVFFGVYNYHLKQGKIKKVKE